MDVGDLVTRNSYGNDIVFRILKIENNKVILEGLNYRLICDGDIKDLVLATQDQIKYEDKINENYEVRTTGKNTEIKYVSGKILHIDGDKRLLNKCLNLYKRFGVYAVGVYLDEKEIENNVISLIKEHQPDILIITGHDSYNKKGLSSLDNYLNSKYFVASIKKVRKEYSKQELIIISGACQSHFEALLASGADFAMSPKRVNIHTYDPAIIAIIASMTPFNEIIMFNKVLRYTYMKKDGVGGLETYGKLRLLL